MLSESIDNTDVPEITEVWRCRVLALPLWISEKGLTSPVVWYFYRPER